VTSEIELTGLDGTNPLGYLAALGVLRTLNGMPGADAPRMRWTAANWRPIVSDHRVASADKLVELVYAGLRRTSRPGEAKSAAAKRNLDEMRTRLKHKHEDIRQRRLGREERQAVIAAEVRPLEKEVERLRGLWRARLTESAPDPALSLGANLTVPDDEFRAFVLDAAISSSATGRSWADFCAAFGCEYGTSGAARMHATPLVLVNGSGHQDFLGSVAQVMVHCTVDHLRRTLLESWAYNDEGYSLRLDPLEDRRHALMAQDPTAAGNKPRTMWGANRLAFEAMPLFPCVPVLPRPKTLCTRVEAGDQAWFYWPLWGPRSTLDTVRTLLTLPQIVDEEPDGGRHLRARGVLSVYRCKRIRVGSGAGRYFNLTPATPVWC
jgi:hypothetical protein